MTLLHSIGTSALLANQRALSTTAHNIANVNTEGYSRQRVDFRAREVSGQPLGQGVDAGIVSRFNDANATYRLQQSIADHGALAAGSELSGRLDAMLSSADSGLATPLRQFVDAVDGLAADPAAVETRVEMLGAAETLAQRFAQLQNGIDDLNGELNTRISGSVDEINGIADRIAKLNDEIASNGGGALGQQPNDLLDQRDQLITELSSLVDVTTAPQGDGSINVYIGNGLGLVVGSKNDSLQAVPGTTPADPTRVFLNGGNVSSQIQGGELGGVLSFRSEILNPAQQELSTLAQSLADAVNSTQAAGSDLNGNPGQPLFATNPPSARLELLISDPDELAAAAAGEPAGSADNSNALALADALRAPQVGNRTLQEANVGLVGRVGAQARRLEGAETAQAALVAHHQNLRDEISGVNLDEEAANMIRYQQTYQAAAQIIATANAMFDSLLAATR